MPNMDAPIGQLNRAEPVRPNPPPALPPMASQSEEGRMESGKDGTLDAQALRHRIVETVLIEISRRRQAPRATYRCQFHGGFGFRDAAAIVPYLQSLGISHLYASPVLRARPGSAHGYDVCDHNAFDPELGGEEGWRELQDALSRHGLGMILDVVPNHMSTNPTNHWWTDVLENGPSSPYAKYFDVDWHPLTPGMDRRVLLPVLGNQYGDVLEAGDLRVAYDEGGFFVRYFDRMFPLDPKSVPMVLAERVDELRAAMAETPEPLAEFESILTALEHLPPRTTTAAEEIGERQRDKEIIKRRLRDLATNYEAIAQFIARNVAEINGTAGDPATFDRLDALLQAQAYRLCHWKVAGDDINYRRFFDINELAALCTEDPEVFFQTHRLILRLLGESAVSGLRIDHIDGLFAPEQYLWRLQWAYLTELVRRAGEACEDDVAAVWLDLAPRIVVDLCHRLGLPSPNKDDWLAILGEEPHSLPVPFEDDVDYPHRPATFADGDRTIPLFVVVEKILGPHEPLPASWPAAGSTGYDFLQMSDGLLVPDDGWRQIKRDYSRLTGQRTTFDDVARQGKLVILRVAMAGELQMLSRQLNQIAQQHRRSRDFSLNMLGYALREILVCFPVYRIYSRPGAVSDGDRAFVAQAVALAKRRNPAIDASVFDFIRDILLLEHPDGLSSAAIQQREVFVGRLQQLTSPVMAKGVEDTSFYVYCPLVSVNEVGNGPESPVVSVEHFHAWNQERALSCPSAMLASSTHDTKRSEDVRTRLSLLAEMPRAWRTAVQRWMRLNKRKLSDVDGLVAPSRNDEYLFYQSLLGVWPADPDDVEAHAALAERMRQYMQKAGREAKQRTSWINPNEAYDRAVRDFVTAALDERRENRFLADFRQWQAPIAKLGLVNALVELTLKLTCPGFPDIYQGQECWSFRLVDPDNRMPIDYRSRQQMLGELERAMAIENGSGESRVSYVRQLAANLADPKVKLFTTWRLLDLRQRLGARFATARYIPLRVTGAKSQHVVAFARVGDGAEAAPRQAVIVVVPRLVARLVEALPEAPATCRIPCGPEIWDDTEIEIPHELAGTYLDVLSRTSKRCESAARLGDLLANFPVAVLEMR